jgi:hypothetical protein
MLSLKAFLPVLAAMVGTTADVLYERQRALVRIGALSPLAGRGPGSGVHLSIESVAKVLIGYAAADTLSEVELRFQDVCGATPDDYEGAEPPRCPLTGGTNFLESLERILAEPKSARSILAIEIDLNGPGILIVWREGRKKESYSPFSFGRERSVFGSSMRGIMKKAHLSPLLIGNLSEALQSLSISGALSPKKKSDFPPTSPDSDGAPARKRGAKPNRIR